MVNFSRRPKNIVSLTLLTVFAALMFGCNQSHPLSHLVVHHLLVA